MNSFNKINLAPLEPKPHFNIKTAFPRYGIPMLKIRRSRDRLIFNMGIPILVRRHPYIEMGPWCFLVWPGNEYLASYEVLCITHKSYECTCFVCCCTWDAVLGNMGCLVTKINFVIHYNITNLLNNHFCSFIFRDILSLAPSHHIKNTDWLLDRPSQKQFPWNCCNNNSKIVDGNVIRMPFAQWWQYPLGPNVSMVPCCGLLS